MKVSVIVPVYNAAPYVTECLDSLSRQTYRDFEVICVDDASTDGSLKKCRKYARRDPRIKVIANKTNQHAGVCRNIGMEAASGEYFLFLDSDDVFELDMLEKFVARMEETSADICLCGADRFDTNTGVHTPTPWILATRYLPDKEVFSRKDCVSIFSITSPGPLNKFFRRSFIEKHNLKWQSLLRTNDLYFTMSALCLAEKITTIPDICYHYRKGIANSLQDKNYETPLLFTEALSALKEKLISEGIYEAVRTSFVNFALNVTVYNFKSLPRDVLYASRQKFLDTCFDKFEFGEHPREIYTVPANFDYIELYKSCADPLVSVVVPVYNVEKYLGKCLDSLLEQAYWNLEVVCVDDGSSDSSPDILASYAEKFAAKGMQYVVHRKKNAGLGAARNTGLLLSKGKYIYFFDSDDYIVPTAMLELCALSEREDLDEVLFSAKCFGDTDEVAKEEIEKYNRYYSVPREDCSKTVSGVELLKSILAKRGLTVSCPLKFFKRGLWIDNNFRFPEGILHEDEPVAYTVLCAARRVQMTNRQFYQRRLRAGSIMTSTDTYRQKAYGYLKGLELLEQFAETCGSAEVAKLIHGRAINLFRIAIRVLEGRKLGIDFPVDSLLMMTAYVLDGQSLVSKQNAELRKQLQDSQAKAKEADDLRVLRDKLSRTQEEALELRNSEAYRIGMFVTWPFRKMASLFHKAK